ncbi:MULTISPECIES: hypothetical protein [Dorea]|nr:MULTISPECIES: hypothetical protein [Dorea]
MTNKLRQYFPVIRSREEVMKDIEKDKQLKDMFYSWREERRKEFLEDLQMKIVC